jgi:O-antigen/teichoic acid export membrane protein
LQIILTHLLLKYLVKEVTDYSLTWATALVVFNIFFYYVAAFFQVKKMFLSLNFIGASISFLQTIILIFLYFTNTNFLIQFGVAKNVADSILIIMSATQLIQMIMLSIYFYSLNKESFSKVELDFGSLKKVFRYSAINFLGTVLLYLIMRADLYFVEKYCNDIALGNYVQVSKIGQMLLAFPLLLGGVIFPYSVDAPDSFSKKITFLCRILTAGFLIYFIGLLILGKFIFVWLLGTDFNMMYAALMATFVGIYSLSMNILFISFFEGKNTQQIIIYSNLVTLIIILIADFLFVPTYGLMAAAIIFSVANLIGFIVLLIFSC